MDLLKNAPRSAEINYLAESKYEEEIMIRTSSEYDKNSFFNHSVFRPADSKEVCRIRIEWKEKNIDKS